MATSGGSQNCPFGLASFVAILRKHTEKQPSEQDYTKKLRAFDDRFGHVAPVRRSRRSNAKFLRRAYGTPGENHVGRRSRAGLASRLFKNAAADLATRDKTAYQSGSTGIDIATKTRRQNVAGEDIVALKQIARATVHLSPAQFSRAMPTVNNGRSAERR